MRGQALLTKRKAFEWIERLYPAPVIVQNVTYQGAVGLGGWVGAGNRYLHLARRFGNPSTQAERYPDPVERLQAVSRMHLVVDSKYAEFV